MLACIYMEWKKGKVKNNPSIWWGCNIQNCRALLFLLLDYQVWYNMVDLQWRDHLIYEISFWCFTTVYPNATYRVNHSMIHFRTFKGRVEFFQQNNVSYIMMKMLRRVTKSSHIASFVFLFSRLLTYSTFHRSKGNFLSWKLSVILMSP